MKKRTESRAELIAMVEAAEKLLPEQYRAIERLQTKIERLTAEVETLQWVCREALSMRSCER